MATDNTPNNASKLLAWKQRAMSAMIEMAKTSAMRHSRAQEYVGALGLPTEIFAAEGGYTVPEVKQSDTVNGHPRADLTPEAIAKHEATELVKFKRDTYRLIQRAHSYGYVQHDVAVATLAKLDLPQPQTETLVEARFKVSPEADVQYAAFTLPGSVERSDVCAKLESLVQSSAKSAIAGIFPDAKNVSAPSGVDGLYVTENTRWPDSSEITA